MSSGIKTGTSVTIHSNVYCGGTRDIAAVWANTAEDD